MPFRFLSTTTFLRNAQSRITHAHFQGQDTTWNLPVSELRTFDDFPCVQGIPPCQLIPYTLNNASRFLKPWSGVIEEKNLQPILS